MPAPLGPEAREKIIVALRAGATRSGAAAASGVSRRVLYDWLKDEEFAEACDQAEGWAETMAQANVRRAGDKDWKASAWWLEHHPRTKQAWRTIFKSEAEISGPGGGPIQTTGIMFQPDREFLAAYARALAELHAGVGGRWRASRPAGWARLGRAGTDSRLHTPYARPCGRKRGRSHPASRRPGRQRGHSGCERARRGGHSQPGRTHPIRRLALTSLRSERAHL